MAPIWPPRRPCVLPPLPSPPLPHLISSISRATTRKKRPQSPLLSKHTINIHRRNTCITTYICIPTCASTTCILYTVHSQVSRLHIIPRETSCINLPACTEYTQTHLHMHACMQARQRVKKNFWFRFRFWCVQYSVHMQCGHGIPECPAYGYLSTEDVGCR